MGCNNKTFTVYRADRGSYPCHNPVYQTKQIVYELQRETILCNEKALER